MTGLSHIAYVAAAIVSVPATAQAPNAFAELVQTLSSYPPTQVSDLLKATKLCEAILGAGEPKNVPRGNWVSRFEHTEAFVLSSDGMVLIFRDRDGSFPTSCGIVAFPAQSPADILSSFANEYGSATPGIARPDAKFPTTHFVSGAFSYRLRDAANPDGALTITVRNKED